MVHGKYIESRPSNRCDSHRQMLMAGDFLLYGYFCAFDFWPANELRVGAGPEGSALGQEVVIAHVMRPITRKGHANHAIENID